MDNVNVNLESPNSVVAVAVTQQDGSDPFFEVTCNPEVEVAWLVLNDVQGEIIRVTEDFEIIYGDDYKKRLNKMFVRKAPVSTPES